MLRLPALSLLVLAGLAPAQDPSKPAQGAAQPQLITVGKIDAPKLAFTVTRITMVPVQVIEKRTVDVNGMQQVVEVAVTKMVTQQQEVLYSLRGATIQTAGGDRLTPEAAIKRLTPGTIVVVSGDGQRVNPAYLRILKEDTVVIIPAMNTPAPPAPVPPPQRN